MRGKYSAWAVSMRSMDGVGKPLPPITSNGTAGSVSTGAADANPGFIIEVSDNRPAPPPANTAKPRHRQQLRPVIVAPRKVVPSTSDYEDTPDD